MDKERVDIIIKSITRTDSYLNYANTKSTIILTLSSASLATISVNITKALPQDLNSLPAISLALFYIFSFLGFIFFILSMYNSLQSINPFLKPSDKENIFSFVDILHYNNTASNYSSKMKNVENDKIIHELSELNYNLSFGLIGKYKKQKTSIHLLTVGFVCFLASIITPWIWFISNQAFSEGNTIALLLLIIIFLIATLLSIVAILFFILFKFKG